MKKLVLCTVCGMLSLVLVGCSSGSESTAIKNLSNQLDRVTNTVNSISDKQLTSLPIPSEYLIENVRREQPSSNQYQNTGYEGCCQNGAWQYVPERTYRPVSNTYSNGFVTSQMTKIQYNGLAQSALKQNLLSQVAMLKSSISNRPKLNKNQISALNNLTNNISKYVSSLNSTKTDINNSIKKIQKTSTNPASYSVEQTGSNYQALNNHMDARLTYCKNLLNTLSQAERIILGNCNDSSCVDNSCIQNEPVYMYNDYSNNYHFTSDSSNNTNQQANSQKTETKEDEKENKNRKNIDTYRPAPVKQGENVENSGNGYRNGNGYNNGYYGNPQVGYNNGYNNGYYNGYNRGPFNPGRNTDTYGPGITNIDTYRPYPNNYYNNGAYGSNNATRYVNANSENLQMQERDRVMPVKRLPVEDIETQKVEANEDTVKTQDGEAHFKSTFNLAKKPASLSFSLDTNKTIERLIKG